MFRVAVLKSLGHFEFNPQSVGSQYGRGVKKTKQSKNEKSSQAGIAGVSPLTVFAEELEKVSPDRDLSTEVEVYGPAVRPRLLVTEPVWPSGKALRLVSRRTSVRYRFGGSPFSSKSCAGWTLSCDFVHESLPATETLK